MQNVDWLTFCPSPALARTVIHFMPLSTTVNAPYLCQVSFTAFGEAIGPKPVTVTLDEARVGQADGVRIEDVFPALRPEGGATGTRPLVGLRISISTNQPRVDLVSSGCLIEVHSQAQVVRFNPVRLQDAGMSPEIVWPALRDAYGMTSVVLVNGGDSVRTFSARQGPTEGGILQSIQVPAGSVLEYLPPVERLAGVAPIEVSWGLLRQTTVQLSCADTELRSFGAYLIQREPQHQQIVSVVSVGVAGS